MPRIRRSLLITLALLAFAPFASGQTQYSQIVVFGDSLSDTGNSFAASGIPPSGPGGFPYFNGRFSNGPIWIDFIQEPLGLDETQVLNFAVGGASTGEGLKAPPAGIFEVPPGTLIPTVGAQIGLYLSSSTPDSNQLTILWAGSNDLLNFSSARSTVNNIEQHVRVLASSGADEFLIPGLSPLGTTPAVNQSFQGFLLNLQSWWFNRVLNHRLNVLENQLGVSIHRVDTFNLSLFGIVFPQLFGLTNTKDAALEDILNGTITPSQGASYFYWDVIHPTSKVHETISAAALSALAD